MTVSTRGAAQDAATDLAAVGGPLLQMIAGGRQSDDPSLEVARSDAAYRRFLDALDIAVYTTDPDGRITFFNEAAATFWGRRPALGELWCGSWRLFWTDGSAMRHDECPMALALKQGQAVRGYEAIVERPDGSRLAFVPYPTPLRDDSGEMVGAVNVLVDVTERAAAEQELRATAAALEASNAVKDEFLGLVSHELRTPVTTIFGNARLLHDRGDRLADRQKRSMVADIATDADRLLGLVENLLLLTKLGAGTHLELEPQVLDHLVKKAVASYRRRHPNRRIRIRRDPGHVVVDADRTYIELLMENLLSNADKYTPGVFAIDVSIRIVGGEVQVVVRDRGIGITDTEGRHVFDPFYRTEAARSQATGIGIGLAVCRRVVEIQGGRIWARPRRNGGAVVGFALPLAVDTMEPPLA